MATPLGQLNAPPSTKSADVELIEEQLMNNTGAGLPSRDLGPPQQPPHADPRALPTAPPTMAFPPPPTAYVHPSHPPPAVPPTGQSALDDYAFPLSLFVIVILVLSPIAEQALKRVLPPAASGPWATIIIKAVLITAGYVALDKLNQ